MTYLNVILLLLLSLQPIEACRLWAVCAKEDVTFSTLAPYERQEIQVQLSEFYDQSKFMQNGWSLLCYSDLNTENVEPLFRSSSPASDDSLLYWSTVESLINFEQGRIGIGHLRLATSGTIEIPNPHPWIFQHSGKSYSLIHNGTVDKNLVLDLITENGTSESWLEDNPPQTFGAGSWDGEGWASVVDSELLLLYIMKMVVLNGEMFGGFEIALNNLINAGVSTFQLNLIFSDGDMLMTYGGGSYALYLTESEQYFAVMSQPPAQPDMEWDYITSNELVLIDGTHLTRYPDFVTSVLDDNSEFVVPSSFHMGPAFPNPFNSSVQFLITGTSAGVLQINIFSVLGEKVDHFHVGAITDDQKLVGWTPPINISSGTYFVNAAAGTVNSTLKILYIK